jgi:hypothetical protein
MNISKYIRFLRRDTQLNRHRGQPLPGDPDHHDNEKIIEYQDRWTLSPSRAQIWLNGWGSYTSSHRARSPW